MKMESKNESIISVAGALLAAVIAFSVGAILPFVANAAGLYTMNVTSGPTVTGPYAITLSGTAAANPQTGSDGTQHIAVDWGEGSGYDLSFTGVTFNPVFSGSGNNRSFTSTWSASHTYAAAGTYTIKIIVYHGSTSGQDGSDLAVKTVTAVIPPATLKVVKHVINNNSGTNTAADFTMHVTGTNIGTPSPANFAGDENGTIVSLFPGVSAGTFSVTEDAIAGYTQISAVGCSGSVSSGQSLICTITNDDVAPNQSPTANNQSVNTNEDTPVGIALTGNDPESAPLTFSLVGGIAPLHGLITVFNATAGTLTYTPETNYYGSDSFTFKVNDGITDSIFATVSITVNPTNDAPVANDDTYNTDEDMAISVLADGVIDNDTDDDGDSLTAALVTGPSHAQSFTLNANGSFDYMPDSNFSGTDSFTYTVSDGSLTSNTATVYIIVSNTNDAPIADEDNYVTAEDTQLTVSVPGILQNDTDADGDSLTVQLESDVNDGVLVLNPDGSFTYTPDPNFVGFDSFTYKANDGTFLSSTQTVTITVTAVNDAPVATDGNISTPSNTPVNGAVNGSDIDGGALIFSVVTTTTNGVLSFNNDGTFSYSPTNGFVGSDFFTFLANDGSDDSNTATMNISVTSVAENTQATCSDTLDNDGDTLVDLNDPDCAAFVPAPTPPPSPPPPPTPPPPPPSGGGSGGSGGGSGGGGGSNGPIAGSFGGGGNGPVVGQVLGASTAVLPELPEGCVALLHTYMRMSKKNDAEEVKKLQQFLNDQLHADLPVTGFFGSMTDKWVRVFQKSFEPQVLTPWGITDPTGYVYKTTQRWINLTSCSSLDIPMPILN